MDQGVIDNKQYADYMQERGDAYLKTSGDEMSSNHNSTQIKSYPEQ